MSFPEAIKSVFQNYVNFSGRARRSEYWFFVLFTTLVSAVLLIIQGVIQQCGFEYAGILTGIFSLAIFVPSLAVSWRRLHDIGKSGLWYFIGFVPLIGWILLIYWFCKDSNPEENAYGPCPKV